MTNEEKILQMLGELQADVKAIKEKLQISNVHTPNRERFTQFLKSLLDTPQTPEDIAEGDELLRNYREAKRNNAIAAAEKAGLKVVYV
ncbi:MAG: hypothetical protein IKE46_00905 [Selenomonadaceae bacterium]|nr:hypothetical protein [Selenomonadaceae bacterium]